MHVLLRHIASHSIEMRVPRLAVEQDIARDEVGTAALLASREHLEQRRASRTRWSEKQHQHSRLCGCGSSIKGHERTRAGDTGGLHRANLDVARDVVEQALLDHWAWHPEGRQAIEVVPEGRYTTIGLLDH